MMCSWLLACVREEAAAMWCIIHDVLTSTVHEHSHGASAYIYIGVQDLSVVDVAGERHMAIGLWVP